MLRVVRGKGDYRRKVRGVRELQLEDSLFPVDICKSGEGDGHIAKVRTSKAVHFQVGGCACNTKCTPVTNCICVVSVDIVWTN